MKNILKNTILSFFLFTVLLFPFLALAQSNTVVTTAPNRLIQTLNNVAEKGGYQIDPTKASTPMLVGLILRAFLGFLGITFLILMILAGYNWMTAEGNVEQVQKAKRTIKQTIIGLIIAVSAWTLWTFVFEKLIIMVK